MPKLRVILVTTNIEPPHIFTVDDWSYIDFYQAVSQEQVFTIGETCLTLTKVLYETVRMAVVLCTEGWTIELDAKPHRF